MSDEVAVSHSYALMWTDESYHVDFYIDEVKVGSRHFPKEYLDGLKKALIPEDYFSDE